jgi:hypothetical protein
MYSWQLLYVAAMAETQKSNLNYRIVEAEMAISRRWTELLNEPIGPERQALADARAALRVLRREVGP